MHIHALDTYCPGTSPIHRLDPRVKLVLTGLFILTAALVPDREWGAFGALEALVLLTILLSSVGLVRVQRRSAVAMPFVLAALTVAFSTPGRVLWRLPLPGIPLTVTDAGLLRFLSIAARSYLSVQAAILLAATTPFPDLLWGMRALRIPRTLVAITGFLYRYLFVLADEARRMLQAREARSGAPDGRGGGSVAWRAQVTGSMAGTLFLRSYERSERIYMAMLARGYDGTVRTLSPPSLRLVDWIVGLLVGMLLAALLLLTFDA
ncbi:MAG TPA: cobalt ECF transporter T component CbiQ [Thermoflexia bacterium]|nr:cobalt ECF transporter T component CbiQ [Thermoflexia bacterium]